MLSLQRSDLLVKSCATWRRSKATEPGRTRVLAEGPEPRRRDRAGPAGVAAQLFWVITSQVVTRRSIALLLQCGQTESFRS